MAILVGDPIVSMRALGPDPCGVLPPPTGVTAIPNNTGGLAVGNYSAVVTYLTPWGESLPSTQQTINLLSGFGGFTITVHSLSPGATGLRVYFGLQGNALAQYQQFDLTAFTTCTPVSVTITNCGGAASLPPFKSSAYLPDSDGGYVSAATAYRWLNAALRKLGVQLGGIRDVSGVAWPSQAAWAILQNRWTEIAQLWWSGWYQQIGRQEYTWMQSPITSVPGYTTQWSNAGRDMIGLWPQPGSGPGSSTLTADIGISDSTIPVAAVGGFTMPGMFQIDDEFILVSAPSGSGPFDLIGVIRGAGGSIAAVHTNGTAITQLITMFSGSRLAPEFTPGSGYTMLQLPAGWDVPLDRFLLARYREKEQSTQEAVALDREFDMWVEQLRSSKDAVPKDKTIGDGRVFNSFNGYQRSGALPFGILVN